MTDTYGFDGPAYKHLRDVLRDNPAVKDYAPGQREAEAELRPGHRTRGQALDDEVRRRQDTWNNALTQDFRDLHDRSTRPGRRRPIPDYIHPMDRYYEARHYVRQGGRSFGAYDDAYDPSVLPGPDYLPEPR
jgi:hypothetical protein